VLVTPKGKVEKPRTHGVASGAPFIARSPVESVAVYCLPPTHPLFGVNSTQLPPERELESTPTTGGVKEKLACKVRESTEPESEKLIGLLKSP
jgi:hypothetical protein